MASSRFKHHKKSCHVDTNKKLQIYNKQYLKTINLMATFNARIKISLINK